MTNGAMLSPPRPSALRHRCGAAGSAPRLAGLLSSGLRGEGASSFLSSTNEIFLLLRAPLGSGSVFYPLSLAPCSSPVITAHTSSQTGLALRPGWAPLHRPLPEAPPGAVGVSPLSLLVPWSAWHLLTRHLLTHTLKTPTHASVPSVQILFLTPGFTHATPPPGSLP